MFGTHENQPGWGQRASDGRMVHVNDVPNGLACGCFCPVCNAPLVARQGKIRVPHFAHTAGRDCQRAGETALHMAAKQVLQDLKGCIVLPEEVMRKADWPPSSQPTARARARLDASMTHTVPARRAKESSVRLEPQDWSDRGFRHHDVLRTVLATARRQGWRRCGHHRTNAPRGLRCPASPCGPGRSNRSLK